MKLLQQQSDKLSEQLLTLKENIQRIEQTNEPIDLQDLQWAAPLSVLPLAARIFSRSLAVTGLSSYLKTISFPAGIDDPQLLSTGFTYIPIARFSASNPKIVEQISDIFSRLILNYIDFGRLVTNSLRYAVDEMVTNINEHSGSSYGWMLAQYFKTKSFLDIVILDEGRGLTGVYEETLGETYTDKEAIKLALEGHSSKDDMERGYGLRTTKKLIVESPLNGKFIIISGTNGYFAERGRELFFDLATFQWQGVIIILRINKITESFPYTDYVE